MATIIDGKQVAASVIDAVKVSARNLEQDLHRHFVPGLFRVAGTFLR